MRRRHELDITIDRLGRVHVEVHGAKGPACLDYVQMFGETLGKVTKQTLTSEYYEPGEVAITEAEQVRRRTRG